MGMPAKTWPLTVSASLKTRRKSREARRKRGDVLSSVWVVESDFEPAGKGAKDGVLGDTHDVPCSTRSALVEMQTRALKTRTDLVLEKLLDIARRHWKRCEFSAHRAATRKGVADRLGRRSRCGLKTTKGAMETQT